MPDLLGLVHTNQSIGDQSEISEIYEEHTLYLYHLEPYQLKGGAARWNEIKEEVADGHLQALRNNTTNIGDDNIIARFVECPLDFDSSNPACEEGDFFGIESTLEQSSSLRPLPGWRS